MAQNYRLSTTLKLSSLADFSTLNPTIDIPTFDGTYDYARLDKILVPAASSIAITFPSSITLVKQLVVVNKHATEPVLLRYNVIRTTYVAGAGTLTWVAEVGATPAHVLDSANGFYDENHIRFEYGGFVFISGAAAPANNGTFLMQSNTANRIYFSSGNAVTAGVDAGTPSLTPYYSCPITIPAGGFAVIPGPQASTTVLPIFRNNCWLACNSASSPNVPCEVLFLGS